MRNLSPQEIAKMIDHAALKPYQTDKEIENECQIALKYNVATICVPSYAVKTCDKILSGSEVGVCCVIGFPHGNSTTNVKIQEALEAVLNGAIEIDMVVNIGKVLSADWEYVKEEILKIKKILQRIPLKVIFENGYLKDEHIIKLCEICSSLHVDFVKTSTGFAYVKNIYSLGGIEKKGANEEQVKLMREKSRVNIKIKASGGIETLDDIMKFYKLGARRFGTSSTEKIMEEALKKYLIEPKNQDSKENDCADCPTGVDCSSCSKRYNEEY